MKARPIIFNGDMVRAILDGRKTQTRRVVPERLVGKWCDYDDYVSAVAPRDIPCSRTTEKRFYMDRCPYGQPGDLLYVRETFALENTSEYHGDHVIPSDGLPVKKHSDVDSGSHWIIPHYRASEPEPHIVSVDADEFDDTTKWTPSIHMPRWASRITLEITDVRVERLQDISVDDARAEGIRRIEYKGESWGFDGGNPTGYGSATGAFRALWDSIYGTWDANPWVWVVEFKPILENVDEVLAERNRRHVPEAES